MSRNAVILVVVFLFVALAGVLLGLFSKPKPPPSFRANGFSKSFVGHKALVAFLEAAGFDVALNRAVPREKRGGGIRGLAVLEPTVGMDFDFVFAEDSWVQLQEKKIPWIRWRDRFDRILVSLPKWEVLPKRFKRAYISSRTLVPSRRIQEALGPVIPGLFHRPPGDGPVILNWPGVEERTYRIAVEDLQTFTEVPADLVVVSSEAGTVVARDPVDENLFWVSDPDVMSNGMLAREENAAFVEALFSFVFPDRAFVLDEVHHGFEWHPMVLEAFVTFPGIVPTIAVAGFILFLFWGLANDWSAEKRLPKL
ncbi:MAG: hypothetical protein ACYTHN_19040, partial [Planctomycetota bacterium]